MKSKMESIIGVMGLGGSYLGLAVTLQYALQIQSILTIIIALIFATLYLFGIFTGYKLLTEKRESTYKLNLYFWLIQTLAIYSPIITYFFSAGAFIVLGPNLTEFTLAFNLQFGSKFAFYTFNSEQPFILYVNLVAAYFSWFLYKVLKSFSITENSENEK